MNEEGREDCFIAVLRQYHEVKQRSLGTTV